MSCFSKIFEKSSEFVTLAKNINPGGNPVGVTGVSDAFKAHLIHALIQEKNEKSIIIVPDEASAVRMSENLGAVQAGVLYYPAREFTFQEVAGVSHDFEHIRLGTLSKILNGEYTAVVCSANAACQKTMPPDELKKRAALIKKGDEISAENLVSSLVSAGYSRYEQVDGISQFAVRGGIVDIFPPRYSEPARIEFWGNIVDEISTFDISTQRRTGKLSEIEIIPASEVLFDSAVKFAEKIETLARSLKGKAIKAREKLYSDSDNLKNRIPLSGIDKYIPLAYNSNGIFDYAPKLMFVCETARVKEKVHSSVKLMNEQIKWFVENGTLCRGLDKFNLDFEELKQIYQSSGAVYLDSLPRGSFDTPIAHLAGFSVQSLAAWNGTTEQIKEDASHLLKTGYTVCIMAGTSRSAKALSYDLNDVGINSVFSNGYPLEFQSGAVTVTTGTVNAGFQLSDIKFALITHLKSFQKKRKNKAVNSKNVIRSLDELSAGDYIVHNVHGIGIFEGIHALELNGVKKDYIKISYAKGDTLYVPVTQLDLVSKYIGPGDNSRVKINRLGGSEWKKAKAKVRASVKDMAKELIALYAKRMSTKGYAFSEDTDFQRDFELRFAYDETDDQLRCAEEIKKDMERPVPMERLLCGDVGFGKTEVALRAAFKCITEGKQCAVLVPTTVLAMQHFNTARARMEAFPVNVEMLSRFVSQTKQKEIIKGLANGDVDLLVGTHRIISKDIKFHDLGLLIVDEEQRFGVAQKERMKEKFPRVDVLTLSATPIPRTLNMALSGIRDMSLIEEAPGDRYPVQTYVAEYDFEMLAEAMEKELARGGQCYYLHNNIETIEHTAVKIKKAISDARVGIAHGKMTEEQLSDVWAQLINGEIDILVCTTIIETGVDVANVNTLIIENADRMGLAQLHQIRGRVGRSSRRAYAYLTFSRGKELTEIASKRLEAIREYTEFGSGFKIAMRDLEIRGAGSILGSRQHGHMEAVGYDMYLKLLGDAVAEEKGELKEGEENPECLIDLPVEAHIPDEYIESVAQKLSVYKRIDAVRTDEDANDVIDELKDRFGTPPASINGLIEISLLRNSAAELGIYEISQRNGSVLMYMNEPPIAYVAALNKAMKGRVLLSAAKKSYIAVKPNYESALETVRNCIEILKNVNNKNNV
ncbi:MAG: transcription-repair coupling factor [Clostridiales bacterium]|nr:transcription-repair coupling factor [Clostridiales bacterium]